ncbi:4Fe-4S dicluster domain-containing protein [Pseudomonas sp. LRF_L74]|uniref:4Fe-4S dicluster domain-containing protein n=1 Tax=Pseudomonas sp. LRF_L74 TaxID=3369422 RepID=UPI003F5FFB2A
MIELILSDRCDGCNQCVAACSSDVLAVGADGLPFIARQADCQTCFMCELYCSSDAIYVHPDCENRVPVDAEQIRNSGLLGQYRRDSGWDEWANDPRYANQHWRMEEIFALARSAPKN